VILSETQREKLDTGGTVTGDLLVHYDLWTVLAPVVGAVAQNIGRRVRIAEVIETAALWTRLLSQNRTAISVQHHVRGGIQMFNANCTFTRLVETLKQGSCRRFPQWH